MSEISIANWGVVGVSDVWTFFDDDVGAGDQCVFGHGVTRIVAPGTVYFPQPFLKGLANWHEKPGTNGRVFELACEGDVPPSTFTLVDLHNRIAPRRGELSPDDGDLKLLDVCVDLVLDLVQKLHQSGFSIGFLQPRSVLFWSTPEGSVELLFPDVGFAWDRTAGLQEPEWLRIPEAALFEEGARERNSQYLEQVRETSSPRPKRRRHASTSEPLPVATEDVRVLSRLLCIALVGHDEFERWRGRGATLQSLPSKDRASDTEAPLWDEVIAPGLAGRIKSCDELRRRLAAAKASEHFLFVPPTPPWPGWVVVKYVTLAASCLIVLGTLWAYKDVLWPRPPAAPYCDYVPATSSLYGALVTLAEIEAEATTDATAYPDFQELLVSVVHQHDETGCHRGCLDVPIENHFFRLKGQALDLLTQLQELPRPAAEEVQRITEILEAYSSAKSDFDGHSLQLVADLAPLMDLLSRQRLLRVPGPNLMNENSNAG